MTDIFLYVFFGTLAVYDIFLAYRKYKTITEVMKHWYVSFIFVPFLVGVIFLGHFLDLFDSGWLTRYNIIGLVISGLIMLTISIILKAKNVELKHRVLCLIPILVGYVIGDMLW